MVQSKFSVKQKISFTTKENTTMNYGLQMYSVRDITGTDLAGALKAVAELGYSFV